MKKAKQLLALSAFLMVVVGLHAEENSTTFTVSATINESCAAVTAQNMAFGLYDPHSSSPVDTTSALCGVLCIAKGGPWG